MTADLRPVHTAGLLLPLHEELIALLRGLAPDAWERPTVAGRWQVRDVVAHLLDGQMRTLSSHRDGHRPPPDREIGSYRELVAFLDDLNGSWVAVARRFSPRVLVDLLAATGPEMAEALSALPPHEEAVFPVAWAGEGRSENWMDVARQYTEQWHHQMQVRDAVGAPLLLEPRWLGPLLDVSVRALPAAYDGIRATDGTAVVFEVPGIGAWTLRSGGGRWVLGAGAADAPAARVRAEPDAAWRLLYNALPSPEAHPGIGVEGDAALVAALLRTRSVMV